MALSESANTPYGGAQPGSPHQLSQSQLEESLRDQLATSPLNKQNSIFSLTLDEIQLKSGKSFGSMNMDEFLTNLWNVDENQVSSQPNQNELTNNNKTIESEPLTLTRQNSFSIPLQICKKTVEEVWSEIQKDQPQHPNLSISDHQPPQRQPTFGEMTLEEFLIKAGVVQEPIKLPPPTQQRLTPAPIQRSNTCLDANYGMAPMMDLGFSTHHQNVGSNFLVNGYATYPIYTPTTKMVGELPNNAENEKSQGMAEAGGQKVNRKRILDGSPEVIVERRQRRMIKNRESAARSRARKQAYTVELELELTQLKEENEKLKQTVKELEQKRAQEVLQSYISEKDEPIF